MRKYGISIQKAPLAQHLRQLATYWQLSAAAKARLEWMIFYCTIGKQNALSTSSYFGIAPKTFHKWKKRFNPKYVQSLEDHSRTPHHKRTWQVSSEEEQQIIDLRKKHLKYGKVKLKILYQKLYRQSISTWKIERVIRKHQLYPDLTNHRKTLKRRQRVQAKMRIREFREQSDQPLPLWHTDTIQLWWYGQRRVIFTTIEDHSRIGYARVYQTGSSSQATDFLKRLVYLTGGTIKVIHHDNGSEFEKHFKRACRDLEIQQIYSRVKTPKDNPELERFNWTVQDEWLSMSEVGLDEIAEANLDLTEWLVEYNFYRPHQALDYLTPIAYAATNYPEVLPMSPARTNY